MTVRYIKLGKGGKWETQCLSTGTLRFGFHTGDEPMFNACLARDVDEVKVHLRAMRNKGQKASVKDDLRQVKAVFWDDGTTVWITFHDRRMYWGRLDPSRPPHREGRHSVHHLTAPGWRCTTDTTPPRPLLKDDLAGHLGMLTQYRGTVCEPRHPDYVLRRIRGQTSAVAERAEQAITALQQQIARMIKQLTPGDFEILVDMAFAAAGWRRQGGVGKTEEDVDLVLVRSSIGGTADPLSEGAIERVGVQVKSKATPAVFDKAARRLGAYSRAMFVYHSGDVSHAGHPHVERVDATRLASMVLDAGLTRWLIRRVR